MPIRTFHRLIARAALALMLFAQAAMAWSTCDWLARAPERAVRVAAEHSNCEDMGAGGAASVCLAHCLSDRQALHKVALDVPAMPPAPVLTVLLPVDTALDHDYAGAASPLGSTGPPRRILLQSFQI